MDNSYNLFLDDERFPHNVTWVEGFIPWDLYEIVRNYGEFVAMIESFGVPRFVSFDHDLGDEHYAAMVRECKGEQNVSYGNEKTGLDCAKWLVEYCNARDIPFPAFNVHSMNPVGKIRILGYIDSARKAGFIK